MNLLGDMIGKLEAAAATMAVANSPNGDLAGPRDPLAAALADIARHYGQQSGPEALTAGLPLVNGRLALDHAPAAARRANLSIEMTSQPVASLVPHDLPVLVMMADGGCDVLWDLHNDDGRSVAILSSPGHPTRRTAVPLSEIDQVASRIIFKFRPASGLDERGESAMARPSGNWLLPVFLESRRIYAEAIAATVALNLLALAVPLFTMNVYDRVLPNAVEATLWALALGAAIATVFDFAIKTLRAEFVDIAGRRADVKLSNLIYGRLLGARAPERPVSAGVRANALREYETLREFFNSATLTAFGDVPFLLLFLIILWVVAGPLAWIPMVAVPLVLGVGWLTQKRLARLSEESFRETAQKNAVAVETIVGLESVKAARAESWAAANWEAAVSDHIRSTHHIRRLSNLGISSIFALQTLTQIAMVVAGFYMVAEGSLTMGALIAGTMLAGRALQPLGAVAMLISRLHQTRLAYRALSEIVALDQERADGARLLSKANLSGRLCAEGVCFRYEKDSAPSIDGVSFAIERGEKVGVIGAIGSGKSTLLKLIHAVYVPHAGRVTVDGIPVHQIDPHLLRKEIGLALQGADLFHGTIRSNIALSDPGASDEDVVRAARAAGALDWILRLPKGFDTPVRERGAGLSGGQRQSVALARALFLRPSIVLLDEPTSDMDLVTEQHVVQSLRTALKGVTTLIVSHRPALLTLADRIIVLENGRKSLDGPKDEVVKTLEERNGERLRQVQSRVHIPARGTPKAKPAAGLPA